MLLRSTMINDSKQLRLYYNVILLTQEKLISWHILKVRTIICIINHKYQYETLAYNRYF